MQASIRVGDVFALLIEFYYSHRNMEQAFRLIESMRQRGIVLSPFLDADLINTVYRYGSSPSCARASAGRLLIVVWWCVCSAMGVEPEAEDVDDGVEEELEEGVDD
jgi:pentatricopeptide repeat protein